MCIYCNIYNIYIFIDGPDINRSICLYIVIDPPDN